MTEPANHPCCFILPPSVLARVVEEGDPEARDAALKTLAASASMRARRGVVQQLGLTAAQLAPISPPTNGEQRSVYDMQNQGGSALPGKLMWSEGDPASTDLAVKEAAEGAGHTYDFYKAVLGRDSLDGQDMALVSSVHYGVDFDNAFWQGTQMVYGDGSGKFLVKNSLTHDVAVIGHEMTHGVTQFTAGLHYSKQSGALNESWSDVFGSLVKQYANHETADAADWLIGAGIMGPSAPGKALRSMKDPGTAFKFDNQPAHMSGYVNLPDDNNPRNDNGGVHINSGIPNKAFYLVATSIGGNAWEKAGPIWYDTLTKKLSKDSQFKDAANATVASANELYGAGSDAEKAVTSAWKSVGVL
ncbi:MAG: M4 family metallopeptidase [Actinomycetota bacterium]|nr:M4 family metallopeptidase [Actinomycetota bacterium]